MKSEPSYVEQVAGCRASFKVFYRKRPQGKLFWDVMWAPGTDEAAAKLVAFAKMLGEKPEIVRVERIDPA